jgi:hypothetical protein
MPAPPTSDAGVRLVQTYICAALNAHCLLRVYIGTAATTDGKPTVTAHRTYINVRAHRFAACPFDPIVINSRTTNRARKMPTTTQTTTRSRLLPSAGHVISSVNRSMRSLRTTYNRQSRPNVMSWS